MKPGTSPDVLPMYFGGEHLFATLPYGERPHLLNYIKISRNCVTCPSLPSLCGPPLPTPQFRTSTGSRTTKSLAAPFLISPNSEDEVILPKFELLLLSGRTMFTGSCRDYGDEEHKELDVG